MTTCSFQIQKQYAIVKLSQNFGCVLLTLSGSSSLGFQTGMCFSVLLGDACNQACTLHVYSPLRMPGEGWKLANSCLWVSQMPLWERGYWTRWVIQQGSGSPTIVLGRGRMLQGPWQWTWGWRLPSLCHYLHVPSGAFCRSWSPSSGSWLLLG